jgi:hypothetical protein
MAPTTTTSTARASTSAAASTRSTDAPFPADKPHTTVTLAVEHVDFSALANDKAMHDSFIKGMKEAVVEAALPTVIHWQDVHIALSAGSVVVKAEIIPPLGVSVSGLSKDMTKAGAKLASLAVSKAKKVPGIEAAVTGGEITAAVQPEKGAADPVPAPTPEPTPRPTPTPPAPTPQPVPEAAVVNFDDSSRCVCDAGDSVLPITGLLNALSGWCTSFSWLHLQSRQMRGTPGSWQDRLQGLTVNLLAPSSVLLAGLSAILASWWWGGGALLILSFFSLFMLLHAIFKAWVSDMPWLGDDYSGMTPQCLR